MIPSIHDSFMQRCIELARKGAGWVSPNPMVGALIVVDGMILAEGWHEQIGGPHAEPNAIHALIQKYPDGENLLKRATLYVSLEPCSHQGRTPPCADLIIRYQIPEVIIGCTDPSEKVAGKGILKLRNAGISVTSGILEAACRELNKRFFTAVRLQRPYIILKWAQTADGFISPVPYRPYRISSAASTMLVHRWRTEEDCILVGRQTALVDNPKLTSREWPGKNPVRIVIDWNLDLPRDLHLFDGETETYIFNGIKTESLGNLKYFQVEFREYLPAFLVYQLYLRDHHSIIIEGGTNLLQQFIAADLWDEARIFTSTTLLDSGLSGPEIKGLPVSRDEYGSDTLRVLRNPVHLKAISA